MFVIVEFDVVVDQVVDVEAVVNDELLDFVKEFRVVFLDCTGGDFEAVGAV